MIDPRDKTTRPTLEEIAVYVQNPVFPGFCAELMERYDCREAIEYSACGLEPGWNVKFKKSGKTLCTIYPKESYFTVMVVVGIKEKGRIEEILPGCTAQLQEIYHHTKEGNGQRWLMLPLEDIGDMYGDIFRLIEIRAWVSNNKKPDKE